QNRGAEPEVVVQERNQEAQPVPPNRKSLRSCATNADTICIVVQWLVLEEILTV
ncbi:hypothetical protein TorRG33x02_118500, partial [Trema orientale]